MGLGLRREESFSLWMYSWIVVKCTSALIPEAKKPRLDDEAQNMEADGSAAGEQTCSQSLDGQPL